MKKIYRHCMAGLALPFCLGACMATAPQVVAPVAPPVTQAPQVTQAPPAEKSMGVWVCELDDVLRYYQRAKKMNAAELNKEYDQISQQFAHSKSDSSRIQLALLLSMPGASFRDEAQAFNLLKEWSRENKAAAGGLRAFGFIFSSILEEMREKDKRADALQKKLDALKSMEKSLMQRDKP